MDAKQLKTLDAAVLPLAMAEHFDGKDALALASKVIDLLIGWEYGQNSDAVINKGILLHALRQLDSHHGQAAEIMART